LKQAHDVLSPFVEAKLDDQSEREKGILPLFGREAVRQILCIRDVTNLLNPR
jgi:hypothetical protein